ncbi:MAG: hypothetical protein Q8R36_00905 [bacterium]|nr:hypothetical protein [bacterium]
MKTTWPTKIWGCRSSLKAVFFLTIMISILFFGFSGVAGLKLADGILLSTALLIFWYSWETMRLVELTKYQSDITMQLKQISQRQLEQNEKEELIRNRAYLTVQNCRLNFALDEIDVNKKVIFTLINKGVTPAQKVVVRKYFTSPSPNEKRFGEYSIGSVQNYLVPDHVHGYQFFVTDWDLQFASEIRGSEKFLVIEVSYSDYHERQHVLTVHYQIRSKEPRSTLILKERYEENL